MGGEPEGGRDRIFYKSYSLYEARLVRSVLSPIAYMGGEPEIFSSPAALWYMMGL